MTAPPPSVTLFYLTLIHYRESVFNHLASNPRIDFSICCGKKSPYVGMKNFEPAPPLKVRFVRNLVLRLGKRHYVAWQWGAITHFLRTRPDVVILLGFDPHILSTIPLFFIAKLLRRKVLWWSHATLGQQGSIGDSIRLFFYRNADGVLTYDDRGRQRLIGAGLNSDTLHTIWNCINESDYRNTAREAAAEPADGHRILYVGRIYREKKLHLLLHAARLLKDEGFDFSIDVVGDGPERQALETLAQELNVDRQIRFHGAVYQDDLGHFLDKASVGVVPSWAGLSVVQFMAAGLPTITEEPNGRNHPPEVSFVIEGETGAFYKFEDAGDLAKVIRKTADMHESLSIRCRELAQARFSPAAVSREIVCGIEKVRVPAPPAGT